MRDIIKKILKEGFEDFDWVGDVPELLPCEGFIMEKLMRCELIESEKRPGWTKYVDKNGDILFLDNIDTGTERPILYTDTDKIWLKCKKMGVSYEQFRKICVNILWETHKRKVLTTYITAQEIRM